MIPSTAELIANEGALRLSCFAGVLLMLAIAERRRPLGRVASGTGGRGRWRANLGLAVIDVAVLRLLFPVLAVAFAASVHDRGGGLLALVDWPVAVEILLAVLAFDLAMYWQHRLSHRLTWLWPLHRVHHSDIGMDVTTGLRFHPLEIAGSMALKLALVALVGPTPLAVVLFELWLSVGTLFTHANIAVPPRVDQLLRVVIATPALHRIHHSVQRSESDSNYGAMLTLWDRLFGTFRTESSLPLHTMPLGMRKWRDPASLHLGALLLQPFAPRSAGSSNKEHNDA